MAPLRVAWAGGMPRPSLPLVPRPRSAQRLGSTFLPDLFPAWTCLWGPSPEVAAGELGQGRWAKGSGGSLPALAGWRGGLTAGACQGPPPSPSAWSPSSLGPVRGREACKLGLGQAAPGETSNSAPPHAPPDFSSVTHACFSVRGCRRHAGAWHVAGADSVGLSPLSSQQPAPHSFLASALHPPPPALPHPSSEGPAATPLSQRRPPVRGGPVDVSDGGSVARRPSQAAHRRAPPPSPTAKAQIGGGGCVLVQCGAPGPGHRPGG